MPENRLLLIDGNSLTYKAFYALIHQLNRFTNNTGLHTNAVYGFNNMLNVMLNDIQPTHVLVAFDAGKTTFRTKMYDGYKGGRDKTPEELIEQFEPVKELLTARGIKSYELTNYEADDIIGTLARQADKQGFHTTVVTGDHDLTQLCSNHTTVAISNKGVSGTINYDPAYVKTELDITPHQIIDLKALQGDSSDNYPGVTGVGPKTALKLIHQFQSLENLYENIDQVGGKKLKEHLIEDKETAFLDRKLATINCESPVDIQLSDIEYHGDDYEQLIAFYEKMNFSKFLSELHQSQGANNSVDYQIIDEHHLSQLADLQVPEISFYLEINGDNYHDDDFVGFAIKTNDTYYV
jgi:DNA polymerase I